VLAARIPASVVPIAEGDYRVIVYAEPRFRLAPAHDLKVGDTVTWAELVREERKPGTL
jgi:hypothetical protein